MVDFLDINGNQDLEKILHYLARKHLTQKTSEHPTLMANFPLDIMFAPEERRMANEVQSKSVKLGNLTEELVRILASSNPAIRVPEKMILGPGVLDHDGLVLWGKLSGGQRKKTAVFSRVPHDEIRRRSYVLTYEMREAYDLSSSLFRTSYLVKRLNEERAELAKIVPTMLDKKASTYLLDFTLQNRDGHLFLGELKASSAGESGNVLLEIRNLIKAALALSNYPGDIQPIAAIAFPAAAAHGFASVFPEQSIWAGEELWNQLLTPPLETHDLHQAMENILPLYRHAAEDVLLVSRRRR